MKATQRKQNGGAVKTLQLASTEHTLGGKPANGSTSAVGGMLADPRYKMYTPAFVTDGVMQRRNKRAQSSQRVRNHNMVYKTISPTGHEQSTPVSVVRDEPSSALSKFINFRYLRKFPTADFLHVRSKGRTSLKAEKQGVLCVLLQREI